MKEQIESTLTCGKPCRFDIHKDSNPFRFADKALAEIGGNDE